LIVFNPPTGEAASEDVKPVIIGLLRKRKKKGDYDEEVNWEKNHHLLI
jgi:hypothetical protein